MAFHANIPRTTILRHMKRNRRHRCKSSYHRPLLTDANKEERVKFALSFVKRNQVFDDMHNVVHVDEKCAAPPTSEVHEVHNKVMFLCAVARPRFDVGRNRIFDGRIGMWPFVVKEPAQRSSKNRPRGRLVTQPQTVTSEVYLRMLTTKVIPAIQMKMPLAMKRSTVFIQQDNARPHAQSVNNSDGDGLTIKMRNQPPNSPDFNVLDLGFLILFKVYSINQRH
ncbi:hypothetical protein H257_05754 [Aphanomyces astaci]|uniref:Transposase Tc1-like domain-containing protein n=1 Tax=Aphanomyces astaci TaxID=112090 RepID=W4GNB2_APHAT|nr:hypothetical protein H257_05754 [Aphanomyces astaci]ETV81167.1 hypothetical protein H257_05754 [Aphanomyces astaci]|eukprot:XP_009829025.1 hypothetical protein H257_05754 [Aphanomyces astaci]